MIPDYSKTDGISFLQRSNSFNSKTINASVLQCKHFNEVFIKRFWTLSSFVPHVSMNILNVGEEATQMLATLTYFLLAQPPSYACVIVRARPPAFHPVWSPNPGEQPAFCLWQIASTSQKRQLQVVTPRKGSVIENLGFHISEKYASKHKCPYNTNHFRTKYIFLALPILPPFQNTQL